MDVKLQNMKKSFYVLIGIVVIFSFHYQTFAQPTTPSNNTAIQSVYPQKSDALGIDFGVGTVTNKNIFYNTYIGTIFEQKFTSPVFAIGARYMHFFNPYVGVDVMKVNFNCPFRVLREKELMNLQLMTGIRGNTPTFLKTMSGYAAVRMGYGFDLNLVMDDILHGIACEAEVGLNFNKNFFIAFSYNLMSFFVDGYIGYEWQQVRFSYNINNNTYALRMGFYF